MEALLSLDFELKRELMTTVRLATGGVCSLMGLNLDESEDCKVCVTEGLLLLMHRGFRTANLQFFQDEGMKVRIAGGKREEINEQSAEDEISAALLEALARDVKMEKEDGRVHTIVFRF